jgi:hypothetical protein
VSSLKVSAGIYGAVLLVSLGAAWARYTAAPEVELGDKVVMLQGESDDLESIVWIGKDVKTTIEARKDERGTYLWVSHSEMKVKKAPHPAPPAEPAGPPTAEGAEVKPPEPPAPPVEEKVEEKQVFKAGADGDKLLKNLSPMLALRKLDKVEGEKLATIGLSAPEEFIEITRKGRSVKLEVGGEAYGTRDRYVRDSATGEIYLVDDEVLRPLKHARTRLPDRTLWTIEEKKIATVTLTDAAGQKLEFRQLNAADPAKATWAPAGREEGDEQIKTWMGKALKLKSTAYATADEDMSQLEARFTLSLTDEQGKSEKLEVLQAGPTGDWWARSEHTRGYVKMLKTSTSSLAEDVPELVTP